MIPSSQPLSTVSRLDNAVLECIRVVAPSTAVLGREQRGGRHGTVAPEDMEKTRSRISTQSVPEITQNTAQRRTLWPSFSPSLNPSETGSAALGFNCLRAPWSRAGRDCCEQYLSYPGAARHRRTWQDLAGPRRAKSELQGQIRIAEPVSLRQL